MFDYIKDIISKQLRISPDKITLDSDIKADLGADSLDILQMLMTLEEEGKCTIPDEALAEFKTIRDIVTYLETHSK